MDEPVNRFLKTHGQKAARVVEILAKKEKFKAAIETDVGKEIMIDAINRMEELLEKVLDEKETPQEKAEFRALRGIVDKWQGKLADYSKALYQIANNKIGD